MSVPTIYTDDRYYEPFIAEDGRVGYRVASLHEDGAETYIYLNPSDGRHDTDVFLYIGEDNDPCRDYPVQWFAVGTDWESVR
jgi:hypothetical protein